MPTHIQAPDGSTVEFPDSMQDADIEAAMGKLFPPPVSGMPGGVPPGPSKPKLPNELNPDNEQDDSFWTSPKGLIRTGLTQVNHGIEHAAEPGWNSKMGGASEMIRGFGKAAIPAALPFAAANPLAAVVGAGVGATADYASNAGMHALGASPEASALTGDVVGGGAGMLAGGVGSKLQGLIGAVKNGGRATQDAALELLPYFGGKLAKLRGLIDPEPVGVAGKGTGTPFGGLAQRAPSYAHRLPPATPAPEAGPSLPGKGTGTPFGGLAQREPSYARRLPPSTPAPEVGPVTPGKGTGTPFGGSAQPSYSAATGGTRAPQPRMPGAPGVKKVEIQHYGDMRINGRTPAGPKMYDSVGRLIKRSTSPEGL